MTGPRKPTRSALPPKSAFPEVPLRASVSKASGPDASREGARAGAAADPAAEDKRLRHPAGGGYARGEETRLRIIGAAIGVFGERGFDGATTREIAQRAGVNPPALQYYFENKEGVYRACADHMATSAKARYEPVIANIDARLTGEVGTEETIAMFCDLLDALVEHMLRATDYRSRQLFMARVQSGHAPEDAIDAMRKKVSHPVNLAATALLSRLSGIPATDTGLRMKSLMLFGQVMVFHVARPTALYVMGWSDFDDDSIAAVKKMVREQTTTTLHGWLAELGRTGGVSAAK